MDLVRVFASRPSVLGQAISALTFPDGIQAKIVEVRRGDAAILPNPALVLEPGDRIGLLAAREAFPALRKHFGDSIRSTTAFSYAAMGLGMSLGVLLGMIEFPVPGVGPFSIGVAGGPLVVALILGRIGRLGPLNWNMPLPANLTLRDFGLMLFLAAVGLGSGAPFVDTVATTGITFLAMGAAYPAGHHAQYPAVRPPLVRALDGRPARCDVRRDGEPRRILSYANQTLPSERIDVAYATIFPSMTILKIICVQVAIALLSGA